MSRARDVSCFVLLQAQGLMRRNAKLTEKQQKQERICVRYYGALVLQGACMACHDILFLCKHGAAWSASG
jgi:hypothetical protein